VAERLTPEDLAALSRLAALDPDAADRDALGASLERVLAAVTALQEADLEGVEPVWRLGPTACPLRDDEPAAPGPDPFPSACPRAPDGGLDLPAPRPGEEAS